MYTPPSNENWEPLPVKKWLKTGWRKVRGLPDNPADPPGKLTPEPREDAPVKTWVRWLTESLNGQTGNTRLYTAARQGTLRELVERFPEGKTLPPRTGIARTADGETFLHAAARNGHLDQVAEMAEKTGLDLQPAVSIRNHRKENFLHPAALNGHILQAGQMTARLNLDLSEIVQDRDIGGRSFVAAGALMDDLKNTRQMMNMTGISPDPALMDSHLTLNALKTGQLSAVKDMFPDKADFPWKSMKTFPDSALYHEKAQNFPDLCAVGMFRSPQDLTEYMNRMPEEARNSFKADKQRMRLLARETARLKRHNRRPRIPVSRPGRDR